MKKIILLTLIFSLFLEFDVRANKQISLNQKGQLPGHSGTPIVPADMPQVYYDSEAGGFQVEKGATFAVYPACF